MLDGFAFRRLALLALCMGFAVSAAFAAGCLVNPADPIGNPVFGASVSTFTGLGIDPNNVCLEDALWTNPAGFGLGK